MLNWWTNLSLDGNCGWATVIRQAVTNKSAEPTTDSLLMCLPNVILTGWLVGLSSELLPPQAMTNPTRSRLQRAPHFQNPLISHLETHVNPAAMSWNHKTASLNKTKFYYVCNAKMIMILLDEFRFFRFSRKKLFWLFWTSRPAGACMRQPQQVFFSHSMAGVHQDRYLNLTEVSYRVIDLRICVYHTRHIVLG